MYWYKKLALYPSLTGRGFLLLLSLVAVSLVVSCKPEIKESKGEQEYFSLKRFFYADSARLAKQNPIVNKTVTYNGAVETKKVHIANWGSELALFINSDINKPAWRGSYSITKGASITIYQAKLPDLKTRKIMVKTVNGKVVWVYVYNYSKNLLYESAEQLVYYPDSLYTIKKSQRVRVIGKRTYTVRGELK